MFRILVVLALFACVASSCGTAPTTSLEQTDNSRDASVVSIYDATLVWNGVCLLHNFVPKPMQGNPRTFRQGYFGNNFNADFAAIKQVVNVANPLIGTLTGDGDVMTIGTQVGDGDIMNISIENWYRPIQ